MRRLGCGHGSLAVSHFCTDCGDVLLVLQSTGSVVVLVDQHAADERVRLERFQEVSGWAWKWPDSCRLARQGTHVAPANRALCSLGIPGGFSVRRPRLVDQYFSIAAHFQGRADTAQLPSGRRRQSPRSHNQLTR